MEIKPDHSQFEALAATHTLIPVSLELLGDRETPVSVFERLAGDGDGFLLESVEGGERWGRWSFVGWNPLSTLTAHDGIAAIDGEPGPAGDPLQALEEIIAAETVPDIAGVIGGPDDAIPPLYAGAVGYIGYDCVRYIERLPDRPRDDRALPELVWHVVGSMAIFDHLRQTILLVHNTRPGPDPTAAYAAAVARLEQFAAAIGSGRSYRARSRPAFDRHPEARPNLTRTEFEQAVIRAKEYIAAGDVFQVVPSLRLEVDFGGDAFAVYRALRLVNPSPFLFFVRHGGLAVAGSSPELMTRARAGRVESRPIAGTRNRGRSLQEDVALEEELLADPKERAEHVMLVDLARNDLGRICAYGSVRVDELMTVERYSHVMHIVSGVSGDLRPGVGPVDVLRATFPHGTVSGAPKVRAMEIIDELEPTARGPYAGAVGYLDFSGNVDTAIALRTLIAAGGRAWVQAGAGVVADSDPAAEYRECWHKAEAVLRALAAADEV
jgi:anthranilate synthase component 1